MTKIEIEVWARKAIDTVLKNRNVEDSFVECKSRLMQPNEVFRQLAGHANSAGGHPILWLFGVDENKGSLENVENFSKNNWFQELATYFDQRTYPSPTDIFITYNDLQILVLLFETSQAPYLVKSDKKDNDKLEVPWRYGTLTRSAFRHELFQLLTKSFRAPKIDLFRGRLRASETVTDHFDMILELDFYVTPRDSGRLTIPYYKSEITIDPQGMKSRLQQKKFLIIKDPFHPIHSQTLKESATEIIIDGPGTIQLVSAGIIAKHIKEQKELSIQFRFYFAEIDYYFETLLVFRKEMEKRTEPGHVSVVWGYRH